jgi:hypothetical protein
MIIGFWEYLGATQVSLREVRENHYAFRETAGTTATVEVLHRTNDLCIVYARGEYRGPLLAKSHHGEILLVLRTRFTRDSTNEPMVICDLDAFIQINSLGADVFAKLFFASLARVADSNFEITASFVSQISRAASHSAIALKGSAEEISSIRPEIYEEFCEIVDRVALRFARRNQSTTAINRQQQNQRTGQPRASRDFALSQTRPPAYWELDHFKSSLLQNSLLPFHESSELSVPRIIESNRSENAIPILPKP